MKINYCCLFLLLCCLLSSCNRFSPEMKAVLRRAGGNRSELVKVLRHYSHAPSDSLKLRAAEFLILNMPGKYSEYYDAPWNDVAAACLRWSSSSDKEKVSEVYGLGEIVVEDDLHHIKADYLINNIDLAFDAWHARPWGKYIPFDVFCEEILPYRLDTEQLENWREKVLASFSYLNEKLDKPGMTAAEACAIVNDALPNVLIDSDFPSMNYSQIMASSKGTCDDMAALAIYVMRTLGIPVTFDFTTLRTNTAVGHSWNSVRDDTGRHIPFLGTEANPYDYDNIVNSSKATYRLMFAIQERDSISKDNIPPLIKQSLSAINVTSEYINTDNISIPLPYSTRSATDKVYLALESYKKWQAIADGRIENGTGHFADVGRDAIYLPVYYTNGREVTAGDAFLLDQYGNVRTFDPDSRDTLLTLKEIYPYENQYLEQLKGGVFEGANKPDFSDARKLQVIGNVPGPYYHDIAFTEPPSYRYFRYRSPKGSRNYMAEIIIYDEQGEALTGTYIGHSDARTSARTADKVFDGDVLTFFESAKTDGAWSGIDFGSQKKIGKISYLPRTGGNSIYDGHNYELFFWNKYKWQSLGIQTAKAKDIQFNAPREALFYLSNNTTKSDGKLFFINSDREIQWK